jgi:hypothetical protein
LRNFWEFGNSWDPGENGREFALACARAIEAFFRNSWISGAQEAVACTRSRQPRKPVAACRPAAAGGSGTACRSASSLGTCGTCWYSSRRGCGELTSAFPRRSRPALPPSRVTQLPSCNGVREVPLLRPPGAEDWVFHRLPVGYAGFHAGQARRADPGRCPRPRLPKRGEPNRAPSPRTP